MDTNVKLIRDTDNIDIDDFFDLLASKTISLSKETIQGINDSRAIIEILGKKNVPIYGVTTGLGEMINRLIPHQFSAQLQKNLIRTHATGIGDIIDPLIVRAILLCRLITFTKGASGISTIPVIRMVSYLNHGIYPLVHSKGSLGASGDLSPMAEIALSLIGENYASYISDPYKLEQYFIKKHSNMLSDHISPQVLHYPQIPYVKTEILNRQEGLSTNIPLSYKEGLSLINGTGGMTAYALMTLRLARRVYEYGILATAFTLAALQASTMPFDLKGVAKKGHESMEHVANDIMFWLRDCKLVRQQDEIIDRLQVELDKGKVENVVVKTQEFLQNAYSLRVIPQVLGGYLDMVSMAQNIVESELNGVDDNPLTIMEEGKDSYIYHGAHFHGQYIGYAMDWMKLPLIQLAQLSDRRIARLIDAKYNDGLTDLLAAKQEGLSCAFEGMQYSSTSVVAEMKSLGSPASIQSIPSNLNNQDLVSMGMISARQAFELAKDAVTVVSVELRTALQAIELRVRKIMNIPFDTQYHQFPKTKEEIFKELLGENLHKAYMYLNFELGCYFVIDDRYLGNELLTIQSKIMASMFESGNNPIQDILDQRE